MATTTKTPKVLGFNHTIRREDNSPATRALLDNGKVAWGDGHMQPPFVVGEYEKDNGDISYQLYNPVE